MDALEAAFERDLREWVTGVYEQRAGVARMRIEQRILLVLDSERRWLIPLTLGVLLGVGAVPVLGISGVMVSLGVLYAGAMVSGYVTMRRAERLEKDIGTREEVVAKATAAWQQHPPFGPDERARLVRLMNLSRAAPSRRAKIKPLLLDEVHAALTVQPLGSWPFLRDLRDLLLEPT